MTNIILSDEMNPGDVLIGACVFCRGCGKMLGGPICVVFPENYDPPYIEIHNFPESDCPVCKMRLLLEKTLDQYPIDMLRQAHHKKELALRARLKAAK